VCGSKNAAKLSFIEDTITGTIRVVCWKECLENEKMEDMKEFIPVKFLSEQQISPILAPIPNQKMDEANDVVKEAKETKNEENQNVEAQFNNIAIKANRRDKMIMEFMQDVAIDEQINNMNQQVNFLAKLPNKFFGVTYKDVKSINN
jgi:hypothetical protein